MWITKPLLIGGTNFFFHYHHHHEDIQLHFNTIENNEIFYSLRTFELKNHSKDTRCKTQVFYRSLLLIVKIQQIHRGTHTLHEQLNMCNIHFIQVVPSHNTSPDEQLAY